MAENRVTQEGLLVVTVGNGSARVSQESLLAISIGSGSARVTQSALCVITPLPSAQPIVVRVIT